MSRETDANGDTKKSEMDAKEKLIGSRIRNNAGNSAVSIAASKRTHRRKRKRYSDVDERALLRSALQHAEVLRRDDATRKGMLMVKNRLFFAFRPRASLARPVIG